MALNGNQYATLRNDGPTHLVGPPFEGTRALCGVFVPMGARVDGRDTLWRVSPCSACSAVLRRTVAG